MKDRATEQVVNVLFRLIIHRCLNRTILRLTLEIDIKDDLFCLYSVTKMLGTSRMLISQGSVLLHGAYMSTVPRVCVVGSGPAGFYTAQQILKVNIFI